MMPEARQQAMMANATWANGSVSVFALFYSLHNIARKQFETRIIPARLEAEIL
jgi:hypothetical protein